MAGPIRVLHVDDEPGFAEMVGQFLERKSDRIDVITETSPAAGLDRLRKADVDCVVSDYQMPETDGLAFLDTVREEYVDMPFILFTGRGSEEIASEAISRGVTEYMQKGSGTDQYAVLANRIEHAVERHRAEREVAETREFFRTLVEEADDAILVLDSAGRIEYAAPSAQRSLGRSAEELVDTNSFELVHPDDREVVTEAYTRLVEGEDANAAIEFRYRRPDGEYVWVAVRARDLLEDPLIGGIVVYAREVAERKERERELREEKAFKEAALGSVVDFYWEIDLDGYVTRWSDEDGSVTGYTTEEAIGMHTSNFHPDDHFPRIEHAIEELLETGSTAVEADLLTKGGERIPYYFTGTTLTDEEGTVEAMCGMGRERSD